MSQCKAYPKYKDSGIEWIGQVPEHWKIAQIKRISALSPKKSTLSEEKDSLCTFLPMEKLRTNAVTLDETRPIHEVYGGYSYFCDGDILIAKVTPCFENGNMAVANGLVNGIGFGSTEINVLRVNGKGHNGFLYYRLQEEQFRTIAKSEMRGTGGLKRVPTELFESFTIGLPDTDEQAAIAATLDRETARIDGLIEKKTRFIELLKEKRQALITHAVTKGLVPNVPMKDSGIEWIGQVPEGWEVKRICRQAVLLTNKTNENNNTVALENIESWTGKLIPTTSTFEGDGVSFQAGDILFGKVRPYLAKVYVAERAGEAVGGLHVIRFTVADSIFCGYLLRTPSFINIVNSSACGATIPCASWDFLGSMFIPLPPLNEQQAIAAFLDKETGRIDALINKTEQSITLLKERRAAFITAAVTGQIDLRGER